MLSKNCVTSVTRTTPWLQRAVYNREVWLKRISDWMSVKIARENAYGWQTGVLLEKRQMFPLSGEHRAHAANK